LRRAEKDAAQHSIVGEARVEPDDLQLEMGRDRFAQVLPNL